MSPPNYLFHCIRPNLPHAQSSPGTDAAAQASAAFSACSLLYSSRTLYPTNTSNTFSPASLADKTYASTLLSHALQLYTFANSGLPLQTYQTSVPQSAASYASSGYTDELVMAGLFLAAALNSTEYHNSALNLYKNASLANGNGALNWDSKTPALAVLGLQVSSAVATDSVGTWQAEAERYLDNVVNHKSNGYFTHGHPQYIMYIVSPEADNGIVPRWIAVLPRRFE